MDCNSIALEANPFDSSIRLFASPAFCCATPFNLDIALATCSALLCCCALLCDTSRSKLAVIRLIRDFVHYRYARSNCFHRIAGFARLLQ